jgi:hypothetical protein
MAEDITEPRRGTPSPRLGPGKVADARSKLSQRGD